MTVQWSDAVRNAMLDSWETAIGPSAKIRFFSGAQPANVTDPDPAGLLVEYDLAADWANAAVNGVKSLSGLPLVQVATGSGNAASYRIYATDGVTCHEQGTITATGGAGDITIDNPNIAAGQGVDISAWSKTAPGA